MEKALAEQGMMAKRLQKSRDTALLHVVPTTNRCCPELCKDQLSQGLLQEESRQMGSGHSYTLLPLKQLPETSEKTLVMAPPSLISLSFI